MLQLAALVGRALGHDDREAGVALHVTGLYASRTRLARLIGTDQRDVRREFARRLRAPVAAVTIPAGQAPSQQTVLTGDEIDLRTLPVPRHHPMDPGQYLSGGFLTTYSRSRGVENSAIQRGWIAGPRELRVFVNRPTHNFRNYEEYQAVSEPMPAAFMIGHHPLHVLGCETRGRLDHWEASGAVARRPLRLVASTTLGDDFLVPADAEFVIEGHVLPHVRRPEGPFGEYPMYYGPSTTTRSWRSRRSRIARRRCGTASSSATPTGWPPSSARATSSTRSHARCRRRPTCTCRARRAAERCTSTSRSAPPAPARRAPRWRRR